MATPLGEEHVHKLAGHESGHGHRPAGQTEGGVHMQVVQEEVHVQGWGGRSAVLRLRWQRSLGP